MANDTNQQFVSVEEAAKTLRVHPNTIYRAIKSGAVPYHKIGNQYRIPSNFFRDGLQTYNKKPELTEEERELFNSTDDDYLTLAL